MFVAILTYDGDDTASLCLNSHLLHFGRQNDDDNNIKCAP